MCQQFDSFGRCTTERISPHICFAGKLATVQKKALLGHPLTGLKRKEEKRSFTKNCKYHARNKEIGH